MPKRKQHNGFKFEARALSALGVKTPAEELEATFERNFRELVLKIAPAMIRAETEKMLHRVDAEASAHPGVMSEAFLDEHKNVMRELIAGEQMSIASGRVFRELFADMNPLLRRFYLQTQVISVAWLVGFSSDEAVRQRYQQEARNERAERLYGAQRAGADGNKRRALARAVEARRILQSGHPETGKPWANQEACVAYLQGVGLGTGDKKDKKITSRSAILKALTKTIEV